MITKLMKRSVHNALIITLSLIISIFILLMQRKDPGVFTSRVFRTSNDGWGYDILVNKKLFIHQESIPALGGSQPFPNPELARKTALLIINKMKNGAPPTVTTFELKHILSFHTAAYDGPLISE